MKELTETQRRLYDTYIDCGRSVGKAAIALGMRRASAAEGLCYIAKKGYQICDTFENPYQLDGMYTGGTTTHVSFNKEGHELKQIWYKDKKGGLDLKLIEKILSDRIPLNYGKINQPEKYDKNTMLELNLPDMHIGALAWKAETGDSNYNVKIAKKLYLSAVKETLSRVGCVNKIRIILTGDITHTNGLIALTPASHHFLDSDSRFQKILDFAIDIICSVIEMCANNCQEVEVYCISGNHDEDIAICLDRVLKAYFRLNDNIVINDDQSKTRFATCGISAFAYAHGNNTKIERIAGDLLTWVARNDITGIRDFYVVQGHYHKYDCKDVNGVQCETMPTLFPKDSFAAGGNWSSKRMLISRIFDVKKGLLSSNYVTPRQIGL